MKENKVNRWLRKKLEYILYPTRKVLPLYKEIGAVSPQWADIGLRLHDMYIKGLYMPNWGLYHLIEYLEARHREDTGEKYLLNEKIRQLKVKIKELEDAK